MFLVQKMGTKNTRQSPKFYQFFLTPSPRQIAKHFSLPLIFVCNGPVYGIHERMCFVRRLFGGSRVANITKSYQISEEENVTMNEEKEP